MMRLTCTSLLLGGVLLTLGGARVYGEWDPEAGLWGKTKETDIRVMTWNVEDAIKTEAPKVQARTAWCAVAHIVASVQPDILFLQEVGG